MLLRIGSKNMPAPPCTMFLPSPVTFHAKPPRGATFFSDGFLKRSPPVTKFDDCRSGSADARLTSSLGWVMNS